MKKKNEFQLVLKLSNWNEDIFAWRSSSFSTFCWLYWLKFFFKNSFRIVIDIADFAIV